MTPWDCISWYCIEMRRIHQKEENRGLREVQERDGGLLFLAYVIGGDVLFFLVPNIL